MRSLDVKHEWINRRLSLTWYLPSLLRTYTRTYVTRLWALLLRCPPCSFQLQFTLCILHQPLCVFHHPPLLVDDGLKRFFRVLG